MHIIRSQSAAIDKTTISIKNHNHDKTTISCLPTSANLIHFPNFAQPIDPLISNFALYIQNPSNRRKPIQVMKTQQPPICSINKSQLNNSTSKACYSFARAARSPKKDNINDAIYTLPPVMNGRATSIGFGKKVDLCPNLLGPSPDKYEKKSEFEASPKKGCSFGLSRENVKSVSIFVQSKTPGPGEYDNIMRESLRAFNLRGRDGFPQVFQSTHTPGPGQYNIKQDTDKQFFYDSRKKSPPSYSIRKGGKQNHEKTTELGPCSYETSLASMGRQILGNKKTEKSCIFPKQARQTFHTNKSAVGPGSYQAFSEFGK